jgi:hypothetical protein
MSLLEQLAKEIEAAVIRRYAGRIFQLGETAIAIDFVPHGGFYLFVDYGRRPRAFVIVRKLKQLERQAIHLSMLAIDIKRTLSDRFVSGVNANDGVIYLTFLGASDSASLGIDLRPRGFGVRVRSADGSMDVGSRPNWEVPDSVGQVDLPTEVPHGMSLSDALDERYRNESAERSFDRVAETSRKSVGREIAKAKRLIENIDGDLRKHGDAGTWKRFGDLILANLAILRRDGDAFVLTDYFDPLAPEIRVAADPNRTPAEVAEDYFRRYTRARNAFDLSIKRRQDAEQALERLESRRHEVEQAIERRDEEYLLNLSQPKQRASAPRTEKKSSKAQEIPQARRFMSSTGFEILVGKKAVDNDFLTFRIAKSHDLWLHAADYPGSHVIVRNSSKSEVPQKVLHEAARLAAFYSDAREMPKAAVNFTMRRFVQKPKRAAPGLVSLSSHKTILVEPGVPESVTKM